MLIVTVTPNPSVDRTVEVDRLVRGSVLRATSAAVDPGGKGINIARALVANAHRVVAVLPWGGAEGVQLVDLLAPAGVEVVCVPVAGAVRANVSIVEPDGTVTKINEPGPVLEAAEVEAVMVATVDAAQGAGWVVLSGSLPPGTPDDFYAQLIARLTPTGARIGLDASGEALQRALSSAPTVVKPNVDELAEAAGQTIVTLGDAVDAAELVREKGPLSVLASLGPDGAVLVDRSGVIHGEAPVAVARSAVGAGDALLAGFLAADGRGRDGLVEGLAWAAAATGLPGSRMPGPADLDRSSVVLHTRIDRDRLLKGRG